MYPSLIELIISSLHPDVDHKILMNTLLLSNCYNNSIIYGLNQWYNCYNKTQLIIVYLELCRHSQNFSKTFSKINIQLYNFDFKFIEYKLNRTYSKVSVDLDKYHIYGLPAMIFVPDKIRNPNEIHKICHGNKNLEELIYILDTNNFVNQFS